MICFYLVRHGQTLWNLSGRYQGSTDVSLSQTGLVQAEMTAQWFKNKNLDAIFTSPLKRAQMTANAIARPHGIRPVIKAEFSEICFGQWEGLTFEEIEERWPGKIEQMYKNPDTLHIEGGESFLEVEARTMKGMQDLLAQGDNKTYVIVSHGAAIRTILCGMLDLSLRYAWQFCQGNANISCIHHYGKDQNWLYFLNLQEHLCRIETSGDDYCTFV